MSRNEFEEFIAAVGICFNEFPVAKSIAKGYYQWPVRCVRDDSSGEDMQDDSLLYSCDDEKDVPPCKTPDTKFPLKISINASIASEMVPSVIPVSPDDTDTPKNPSFEELDEKFPLSQVQASEGKFMSFLHNTKTETCLAAQTSSETKSTAFENWSLLLYGNENKNTHSSEPAPDMEKSFYSEPRNISDISDQSSCDSKQSSEAARLNVFGTFAEADLPISKSNTDDEHDTGVITSLREQLVCAVEQGDWENAESKAAAIMIHAISNDEVMHVSETQALSTDHEGYRIARLNELIDAEDWQAVVAAAATLHCNSEGASMASSPTFVTAGAYSSGRIRRYSSTQQSFETARAPSLEEDACAHAEIWSDIARRSSLQNEGRNAGADIAAEWAISRSFSNMLEETIHSTHSSKRKPREV